MYSMRNVTGFRNRRSERLKDRPAMDYSTSNGMPTCGPIRRRKMKSVASTAPTTTCESTRFLHAVKRHAQRTGSAELEVTQSKFESASLGQGLPVSSNTRSAPDGTMIHASAEAERCFSGELNAQLQLLCLSLLQRFNDSQTAEVTQLLKSIFERFSKDNDSSGSAQYGVIYGLDLSTLSKTSPIDLQLELEILLEGGTSILDATSDSASIRKIGQIAVIEAFLAVHLGMPPKLDNVISELQFRYQKLGCTIRKLDDSSQEYPALRSFFDWRFSHVEIYTVERDVETQTFRDPTSLYFHGTNSKNLLPILQEGLLLDNPNTGINGQYYGKGLYFADNFETARRFCVHRTADNLQCMLIAEVCVGRAILGPVVRHEDTTSSIVSCHNQNSHRPTLPDGTILPQGSSQVVVIRDEARIKLRFLLRFS